MFISKSSVHLNWWISIVIINDNGRCNTWYGGLQNTRCLFHCKHHVSNKKRWFMLLREYPQIARHRFYGGILPIHKGIENKCQYQIIEKLIETWPELLQVRNANGKFALHIASMCLSSYKSMKIIILTYPEVLSMRYNKTQLPLHDSVARHLPLDLRFIQMMVKKTKKVPMKQCTTDKMCYIFHSKFKMYLNAWYPIWETSFVPKNIRKRKKMAWCHCIWLVGIRTSRLLNMFWKNTTMQRVQERNRNYPFHLACD